MSGSGEYKMKKNPAMNILAQNEAKFATSSSPSTPTAGRSKSIYGSGPILSRADLALASKSYESLVTNIVQVSGSHSAVVQEGEAASLAMRRGSFLKTNINLSRVKNNHFGGIIGNNANGAGGTGSLTMLFDEGGGGGGGGGTPGDKPTAMVGFASTPEKVHKNESTSGLGDKSPHGKSNADYRLQFQMEFHRMYKDARDIYDEHISEKIRLIDPMPLHGRANQSVLITDHLRRVPRSVTETPVQLHLSVVTGPSYEWVLGVPFNPCVRLALNDPDGLPIKAWCANIEIRAYLLNGVGDVIRENYHERTALLGDISFLVEQYAEFPELRIMLPSSQTKCGWFQIAFVAVGYAITPVLSDRFEIVDERPPRHPHFMLEDEDAIDLSFSTPIEQKKKKTPNPEVSPLHVAVSRGQVELCRLMLDRGDRGEVVSVSGFTPLHLAAYLGFVDVLDLLVSRGGDVNRKSDDGLTALHFAILGGRVEAVKFLINLPSCDINAETNSNLEPVHLAARAGNSAIIRALISRSPSCVNILSRRDHQSALHIACFHGYTDIVQMLLEAGADPHQRARQGWTLAHVTVLGGHLSIIDILVSRDADLDHPLDTTHFTPLHLACLRAREDFVQELLSNGVDPNRITSGGWTIAHLAAISGDEDTYETAFKACTRETILHSTDLLPSAKELAQLFVILSEDESKLRELEMMKKFPTAQHHVAASLAAKSPSANFSPVGPVEPSRAYGHHP